MSWQHNCSVEVYMRYVEVTACKSAQCMLRKHCCPPLAELRGRFPKVLCPQGAAFRRAVALCIIEPQAENSYLFILEIHLGQPIHCQTCNLNPLGMMSPHARYSKLPKKSKQIYDYIYIYISLSLSLSWYLISPIDFSGIFRKCSPRHLQAQARSLGLSPFLLLRLSHAAGVTYAYRRARPFERDWLQAPVLQAMDCFHVRMFNDVQPSLQAYQIQ